MKAAVRGCRSTVRPIRNPDGKIVGWTGKCRCGEGGSMGSRSLVLSVAQLHYEATARKPILALYGGREPTV
jgi:hypothetical protein